MGELRKTPYLFHVIHVKHDKEGWKLVSRRLKELVIPVKMPVINYLAVFVADSRSWYRVIILALSFHEFQVIRQTVLCHVLQAMYMEHLT